MRERAVPSPPGRRGPSARSGAEARCAALVVAAALAGGCGQGGADVGPPALRQTWPVMGTTLQIAVWDDDAVRAREGMAAARAAIFRVDTLMSLWQPDSDLSLVNRRAGTDSLTTLDPETAEVLRAALAWAERSGGAFDPTVGPLVDVWTTHGARGTPPSRTAVDSARALVGWERVTFRADTRAVRLPLAGMRLDLGGIAKGWAVDRGAAALRRAGVPTALVDLGGNVRAFGAPPSGSHWRVGVRDPRRTDQLLAVLELDSGAVATSGDYERFFVHDGVRYGHILDPRTGAPARGVAGLTAVAPTGLEADALSTVLFLLGPEAGCALATGIPGAGAVWIEDPAPGGGNAPPDILPRHLVVTRSLAGRLAWIGGLADDGVRHCGA